MSLLPPVAVGPISECSSSVRVQSQLIGSTVDLFQNGSNIGGGPATSADQVFPLKGGVTLAAGANITATQTSGGQTSPPSPAPVVVQKKPPTIGPVGCETHIYECGQCLWLDGMVPGATVEVTVLGVVRGTGATADGSAVVGLSPQTSFGDTLVVQQTACGTPGTKTNLAPPDHLPGGRRALPAPTVDGPLLGCQTAVQLSNVTAGAQITMTETPGFSESTCFPLSGAWLECPPLTQGSGVSALQTMLKCDVGGTSSPAVPVGPPTPPPPIVVPPLCAGGVLVTLANLIPGAIVEIFQNGISLGQASTVPESTFTYEVPALTGGAVITATQELCNHKNATPSNAVKVDPAPSSLPTPVVAAPLVQCGAAVHVSDLHPGAMVFICSELLGYKPGSNNPPGGQIGRKLAQNTQEDVPVAPLLLLGDIIFAIQQGCGLTSSQSAGVPVGPLGAVNPPGVEPAVETCMRSVTVSPVMPGAHVDVYVNGVFRASAIATGASAEVPLNGTLNVGDQVQARQSICGITTALGPATGVVSSAGFYYLTQHFNNARTGWFPYETTLNVATVPKMQTKPLITQKPDGTVYAQPLYAHHVNIPGLGAHNVVYVATENDTVYAFDADTQQPALWQRSLIPAGEQVVHDSDIAGCNNISPVIGITGTPVIDCASYTMWVVAKTRDVANASNFHHRLYAIDISTGADRPGSPVEIQATYPGKGSPNDGKGNVVFLPQWHMNRPGLLLLNGRIYIGFGSHCDSSGSLYHGWAFVYDATTLQQVGVFCTTPDSDPKGDDQGAVWQGGIGLAADPEGFVYFITGNGEFDANTGGQNYGDTALKLPATFAVPPPTKPVDYFTPANQSLLQNGGTGFGGGDVDFGSGGPLILPDPPPVVALPQAMVACGKDGQIYLINRQNMGKYSGPANTPPNPDKVLAVVQLQPGQAPGTQPGVWGGPAYFNSGQQQFIYYAGAGGPLTAFVVSGASLALSKIGPKSNETSATFPTGGTTPIVSSNQQTAGTGVVWAVDRNNPLHLLAWDATDLTKPPLFNQPAGQWLNPNGGAFIEPTVIQGKVYVASDGLLNVFG